ncbi:hypothetical protein IQ264_18155 [Phormidium sp. LEGE 05292]|uniref:hypothetical protein n=1 Tax=[Phormidium] sp. LEGE 05292 TaxID=767427 RepID=UPI00187F5AC3|nr:hypothetical protein [Phormidium sp. LEGE 05292]MBE9227354.1 hypothetical protein [Phormidium sp. LEGE 05292]
MKSKSILGVVAICTVISSSFLMLPWQSTTVFALINVPTNQVISPIKGKTQVPILIPSKLPFSELEKVYFNSEVTDKGYSVSFNYTPDCQGTPCYIGSIEAERGGEFIKPERGITRAFKRVRLAGGNQGVFHNGCGAYCTATLEWKYQGILYRVTIKNGEEKDLIAIANSAIQAGRR